MTADTRRIGAWAGLSRHEAISRPHPDLLPRVRFTWDVPGEVPGEVSGRRSLDVQDTSPYDWFDSDNNVTAAPKAMLERAVSCSPLRFDALAICLALAVMLQHDRVEAQERAALTPRLTEGWEVWRTDVPVSGDVRVGVMVPGREQVDPTMITVMLPETSAAVLCVEISSRDGRYSARLEYDVAGEGPGPLPLEVPTERRAELREYEQGELAILAGLHAGCETAAETFIVASWGRGLRADRFVAFLNSRVPTMVLIGSGGRVEHEIPCNDLSGVTTAYNLGCEIASDLIGPDTEVIVRQRRGRGFSSIPLPIRLR